MNSATSFKMKMTVLSPVFIGSGEVLKKQMYVYDSRNSVVVVLDEHKWVKYLMNNGLYDDYLTYITENSKGSLYNYIRRIQDDGYVRRVDYASISKYSLKTDGLNARELNDIALCVKDVYGDPYIPGSSLKGAIRTAILDRIIDKTKATYQDFYTDRNKGNADRISKDVEKKYIDRNQDMVASGLRGLSISDSTSVSRDCLHLYQENDYSLEGKSLQTLPIFRECLSPGTELEFTVTLDRYWLERIAEIDVASPDGLINTLNEYWNRYTDSIIVGHEERKYIPEKKDGLSGMLVLGGGVGYHSKTFTKALFRNRAERVKFIADKVLHKEQLWYRTKKKMFYHKADSIASPRTLKLSVCGKDKYINGITQVEVV